MLYHVCEHMFRTWFHTARTRSVFFSNRVIQCFVKEMASTDDSDGPQDSSSSDEESFQVICLDKHNC